ncbi:MAG: GFA family protein [Telluria sp.]
MKKTYHGSCHCGVVRFEADIDFSRGTIKCNCTICTKLRLWPVLVNPTAFRLLAGEADLTTYEFHKKTEQHYFCRHCGVRSFGLGKSPRIGPFYAIQVTCFDDVTVDELVNSPVTYVDGRNDIWDKPPADVRHL